jgi:hypothetical protein
VQLDVQPKGGGKRRPIKPGETLNTGDQIALRVKVDRDAYLYVAQTLPGGRRKILFPSRSGQDSGEELRVAAQVEQHLPAGDAMLELEADTNEENLYIVASTRPLPDVDPALYKRLSDGSAPAIAVGADTSNGSAPARLSRGLLTTTQAPQPLADTKASTPPPPPPPPPPAPRPPPEPISPTDRDPRDRELKPYVVRVRGVRNGVAVAHFAVRIAGAAIRQGSVTKH